jgi:nucleotide-binding universal stress UspA family protein
MAPTGAMARLAVMEEIMIGTVIVPLDGSELAEQALPFATAIAGGLGVPLELLRVVPAGTAGAEDDARTYLNQVRDRVGDHAQVMIQTGQPAAQIVAVAEAANEPLIIMTTHGRGGIGRVVFGSVADKVLRGVSAPLLLIRSGTPATTQANVQTIMVPIDGSAFSEVAIPYAELLARVFKAEVRLVRVIEATYVTTGTVLAPAAAAEAIPEVREATEYLAGVAQRLRDNGIRVQTQVLEGFPTNQLLAYEKESGADLVVMATHSRTGLGRLVYGSVAERVLNNGAVPVLMVQPQE